MIAPAHKDFLIRMGARDTPHSGRFLYDHLEGVYGLLKRWDNPESVCLAGLFHSVYGTSAFKKETVALSARGEVRALIGVEAESLGYLFSVCERYSAFFALLHGETTLTNRLSSEAFPVDEQPLAKLLEMEIANFVDHLPGLTISKPEPRMQRMLNAYLRTMKANASDGAFLAVQTVYRNSFPAA